jgi:hypothetical protein
MRLVLAPYTIESIVTNQVLTSYQTKYLKATSHKAFAQSESGAWNWKSTIKSALISCQVNNKKSESIALCKIINIDGIWTNG